MTNPLPAIAPSDLRIVYTAMHGVGAPYAKRGTSFFNGCSRRLNTFK